MFAFASSFNQNLCAWRDRFPYGFDTSEAIFDDTACTYTDRPRKRNEFGGPFCASDCSSTEPPKQLTSSAARLLGEKTVRRVISAIVVLVVGIM